MKQKRIGAAVLAVLMFSLCGCQKTSSVEKSSEKEKTTTTSAETTTDTQSTEAAENGSDTETSPSSSTAWFQKGVYEVRHNGATEEYYIFHSETSGRTSDTELGIGVPFNAEQSENSVMFHMASVDDDSEMMMSRDESGNAVGTMNGETYTFIFHPELDPDTFAISGDIIDQYAGTYSDPNFGICVMDITNTGDGMYSVHIHQSYSNMTKAIDWDFTGEVDGRQVLSYSDCVRVNSTELESGGYDSTTAYQGGTGYIQFTENDGIVGITWSDDQDDAGRDMYFTMGDPSYSDGSGAPEQIFGTYYDESDEGMVSVAVSENADSTIHITVGYVDGGQLSHTSAATYDGYYSDNIYFTSNDGWTTNNYELTFFEDSIRVVATVSEGADDVMWHIPDYDKVLCKGE